MKTELIKELEESHVYIKNEADVLTKLKLLFEGGASSLQVISDFDMTLSRYSVNNKRCPSSHGILESCIDMTQEARVKHTAVNQKYFTIERDPHMTVEEKLPYMLEWWGKAHEAMGNAVIQKSFIHDAVEKSNASLKYSGIKLAGHEDGCSEAFKCLNHHDIPLLIFSAGLGDVIEEVIRQKTEFYPNMHIVSNFMEFDKEGVMVGFKGQLIHTFNKNEGALANSMYFNDIAHRHNIIMLGDMMGDLHMADGVQNINTILKIGYLNNNDPVSLEKYMDVWDIVLVEDASVGIFNAILSKIVES